MPSSREHASARARRSLPDVGEFAQTQFIIAMLIVPASWISDSGSGNGSGEHRSGASRHGLPYRLEAADLTQTFVKSLFVALLTWLIATRVTSATAQVTSAIV